MVRPSIGKAVLYVQKDSFYLVTYYGSRLFEHTVAKIQPIN